MKVLVAKAESMKPEENEKSNTMVQETGNLLARSARHRAKDGEASARDALRGGPAPAPHTISRRWSESREAGAALPCEAQTMGRSRKWCR